MHWVKHAGRAVVIISVVCGLLNMTFSRNAFRQSNVCRALRSSISKDPKEAAADVVNALTAADGSHTQRSCPFHYRDTRHPFHWLPQPSNKWNKKLHASRKCDDGIFCNHTLTDIELANGSFFKHQHPVECRDKKYLIVTAEQPKAGLGSIIHIKALTLLVAATMNRILIDSPEMKWPLTNPKQCPQQKTTGLNATTGLERQL